MISLIAAVDKEMGIGKNNKLLCYIKEDLKHFKKLTEGNIVVMGYNTYLSLPKKPLPNRINIVITSKDIMLDGVIIVHNINALFEELVKINSENKEVFICGGASIYEQLIPYADKLYITHIFNTFEADTFFPDIKPGIWDLQQIICGTEMSKFIYEFAEYKKREG